MNGQSGTYKYKYCHYRLRSELLECLRSKLVHYLGIKPYCLPVRSKLLCCLYASSSIAYAEGAFTACTHQALLPTQQALWPTGTQQATLPTQQALLLLTRIKLFYLLLISIKLYCLHSKLSYCLYAASSTAYAASSTAHAPSSTANTASSTA